MQELEKDKNDYFKRRGFNTAEQAKIEKMFKENELDEITDTCKNGFVDDTKEASLNDENCPYWGPWRSIGRFGEGENKCSKECGLGKRYKIRDCYIEKLKQNKPDKCINEFIR